VVATGGNYCESELILRANMTASLKELKRNGRSLSEINAFLLDYAGFLHP